MSNRASALNTEGPREPLSVVSRFSSVTYHRRHGRGKTSGEFQRRAGNDETMRSRRGSFFSFWSLPLISTINTDITHGEECLTGWWPLMRRRKSNDAMTPFDWVDLHWKLFLSLMKYNLSYVKGRADSPNPDETSTHQTATITPPVLSCQATWVTQTSPQGLGESTNSSPMFPQRHPWLIFIILSVT